MILRLDAFGYSLYSIDVEKAYLVLAGVSHIVPVSDLRACRSCGALVQHEVVATAERHCDFTFDCRMATVSSCAEDRPAIDISALIGAALAELSQP